jgi:hypothetical protein
MDKPSAEWTEEEAKEILTESPWAQPAQLEPTPAKQRNLPRISIGGGTGGGGLGYPGGGRRGGGVGIPGAGGQYPPTGGGGQQYPRGGGYPEGRGSDEYVKSAPLTVRWESALPIQQAEQKAGDAGAEGVGKTESDVYRIAVFGLEWLPEDASKDLKKHASLQVDGMKDIKPSKVQILRREDGPVILYTFPRSKKISVEDYVITFVAEMGRMQVSQTFYLEKMMYNGKLEM